MSSKRNCCLCLSQCEDYQNMQDDAGASTEFYNITVKYFDPMLIAEDSNTNATPDVLCLECWSHVYDFHSFQSNVLKARSLLLKAAEYKKSTFIFDREEEISIGNEDNAWDEDDGEDDASSNNTESQSDECEGEDIASDPDRSSIFQNAEEQSSGTFEIAEEEDSSETPTKSDGDTITTESEESVKHATKNKPKRSAYNLAKGRQIDDFISKWKPDLECDLCPVTAKNFDALRSHFREQHHTRFYIKCCERKFYRRCILFEHIKLHINPETHKCDVCGKSSTSKYNLKLHKQIVHNTTKDFKCKICNKEFNHKPSLDRHLLTHASGEKEFFCKHCGKGYVMEIQLNTHIRNVHSGARICDQCGKTFHNTGTLKKHLMAHGVLPMPTFRCDDCGTELKSNEALKRHKAAYHHDGSTAYICGICGKVAASEHALRSHKKFVHDDRRNYKCTFCNKAFRTPAVLKEHIATHTGEYLYQCAHCPQTFKTSANMHHHRKRFHPSEWAASRKDRMTLPKVNLNNLQKQIVM